MDKPQARRIPLWIRSREVHRRSKAEAARLGISLETYVQQALQRANERYEKQRERERLDNGKNK